MYHLKSGITYCFKCKQSKLTSFHRVKEHPKRSSDEDVMAFSFKTSQFTLLTLETVCDTRFQGS